MRFQESLNTLGFSRQPANYREILLSTVGGFLGIYTILIISYRFLDPATAVYIVPSMGASAVLLFAAPHAQFSQPWNVIGGHLISALIGVACWQWIANHTTAAAVSVGLATGVMYFTRCIHPPGGATALAAVIGGEKLHELGYFYIFTPILLNAITILFVAIAFNVLYQWRRYPAHWPCQKKSSPTGLEGYAPIKHEDFVFALSHIDTYVDITEEDLLEIYQLATNRDVTGNTA